MSQVKYTTWQGVTFEAAKDLVVDVQSGEAVSFLKSTFRNAGGTGLRLNGKLNIVDGCSFYGLGRSGIEASGGSRALLTPSGAVIQNCDIHHTGRLFSMSFAIALAPGGGDCVGVTVQQNELHHVPYHAVGFMGNNHIIRWNKIHHASQWTTDSGAIYTGKDWGARGTLINGNLFQANGGPLGASVSGVFVDDTGAGVTIEGNIFYNNSISYDIVHGGGRDVVMRYNIFYGSLRGVGSDNRGATWAHANITGNTFLERIAQYNYQSPPWSTAYPELAAIPNDYTQLMPGSHWLQPEGCKLYGNAQFGPHGLLVAPGDSGLPYFSQKTPNIVGQDPLFRNAAAGDFSLSPNSPLLPMWSTLGFPGIDVAKIGIRRE